MKPRPGHVSGRDICLPLVLRGPGFQVANLWVSSAQEAISTGGSILCVPLLSKCSVAAFCVSPFGSWLFSLRIVVGLTGVLSWPGGNGHMLFIVWVEADSPWGRDVGCHDGLEQHHLTLPRSSVVELDGWSLHAQSHQGFKVIFQS